MRRLIILALLGCGACGNDQTLLERSARKPDPLGTLQTRDYTIEVYAGPAYSIYDADGRALAELVTTFELHAQLPELSDRLHQMLAASPLHADALILRD